MGDCGRGATEECVAEVLDCVWGEGSGGGCWCCKREAGEEEGCCRCCELHFGGLRRWSWWVCEGSTNWRNTGGLSSRDGVGSCVVARYSSRRVTELWLYDFLLSFRKFGWKDMSLGTRRCHLFIPARFSASGARHDLALASAHYI